MPLTISRLGFSTPKWRSEILCPACVIAAELNGTNFYFEVRDRVLNLQDYHRSLDNLAAQGAFNVETKRPWNKQDADARWAQVQKQAVTDQANCALVSSLPFLQKKLKELEQQTGAPVDAASK